MRSVASYEPSGIDVRDDGGEKVGLRFELNDEYVEVIFRRHALPALFQHILTATRTDLPTRIEGEHLNSVVVLEGHDTAARSDGGVDLTIHLRTDDGMRSLTWPLTAEAARSLAAELTGWAA